ncbi:MAG: hypothetical protein QGI45_08275 [Myxococcota bacterium]|nr:hypothetical protein [Myxococcota bacterium]
MPGQWRFHASQSTTRVHSSHSVEEEQFEPGIAHEHQAREHRLHFWLSDFDLAAAYGVSPTVEIQMSLPVRLAISEVEFIDEHGDLLEDFESIHHRRETLFGPGDLRLQGVFHSGQLLGFLPGYWRVGLGLSLPTGSIEKDPFKLGEEGKKHQHIFFGHGTVDPTMSLAWSWQGFAWGWQVSSSLQVPLYENRYGYRAASHSSLGVGLIYQYDQVWRFLLESQVFHQGVAKWSGEQARNSGRTDLIPGIGLIYLLSTDDTFSLSVRSPQTLNMQGGQMEIPFILTLGWNHLFAN